VSSCTVSCLQCDQSERVDERTLQRNLQAAVSDEEKGAAELAITGCERRPKGTADRPPDASPHDLANEDGSVGELGRIHQLLSMQADNEPTGTSSRPKLDVPVSPTTTSLGRKN
jgi:hypothetical protein